MQLSPFLTPQASSIIGLIRSAKYSVGENTGFCSNRDLFGYVDVGRRFVICTRNIIKSGLSPRFYINETIYHEGVHVAHHCNSYKPFGIAEKQMPLPPNKLEDVKNSVKTSTASSQMEHEAYWMEDAPLKVRYVIKKYCF